MMLQRSSVQVPEAVRQEVFRLLVIGLDYGMSVAESRAMAGSWFGLNDEEVLRIEQEGLQALWAPL
jgi:hypothetical protein